MRPMTARMTVLLKPTGAMLVGIIFICLLQGLAAGDPSLTSADALSKMEEFHSDFIHHQEKSTLGQLQHPENAAPHAARWALGPECSAPDLHAPDRMQHSQPTSDRKILNGSNPEAWVKDLSAVNAIKQRDLVYGESQFRGSGRQGLVNSMNVRVAGERNRAKEDWSRERAGDFNIEGLVDGALGKGMRKKDANGNASSGRGPKREGNYLNVDVSGISVSAINTVEGGSAVATSNIIIKPVQIIVSPAEVDEKLR